ncbi:hypothetical protein ABB37_02311 [Leptomonas pyrrhocoris]|uniref:Uncharacterized protein n=1 Tax=Leptomonas pyrrhocoris TaxID=157538 RepID=A0A0M9G7Q9_LEPPY|nr:hypothetical protein ABB37_02311 [Leptomonas pyrrhocoris]XP_015662721.1 hypothetical protein ABB37_02311 [Leptomonas pyrrhocoris]XP_015662722.1 hypothetical protein ABB37_02311 [Leptomonas pyrrhocoris]KPA84281.1 hypothetical protein ABB37_02311 [Leptomonas pyrrhocoris]KPA84282.1 hypothetical protein ABB37_02311 [Leptomonas pyrrhocoris]KPA84283.1 hypothetical protein ABB37_02311 [Leptomonas pyrrhocoris]|eukprot:XP_015662720.1 hypothetical protein ABB37_02311 [Leptomonas pyrrhocoris]
MSDEIVSSDHVSEPPAPSPSTVDSSTPATLPDSFHLRQAQALHRFLHPSRTLPDEAAVAKSPDLSSAEEDREDREEEGDATYRDAVLFGAASQFWLPSRTDSSFSGSHTPPAPLPRPSVVLGGACRGTVERQRSAGWPAEMMVEAAVEGNRRGTRYPDTVGRPVNDEDAQSTAERTPLQEATDREVVASVVTASSAALPGSSPATKAAAAVPAAVHDAFPGTACEDVSAASRSAASPLHEPHVEASSSPSTVGRTRATNLQGTPALVVWKAETRSVEDGVHNVPQTLFPSALMGRKVAAMTSPRAAADPDRRGAAVQQQRRRFSIDATPARYSGYHSSENADGRDGAGGEPALANSSSESDSEDIFDDNGGGSGCIFTLCLMCCTWIYSLLLRCCGACYNCCRHCRLTASSFPSPRRVFSTALVSANEGDNYGNEDVADAESLLRRPLLSATTAHTTIATNMSPYSSGLISPAMEEAASSRPPPRRPLYSPPAQASSSASPTLPLPRAPTRRAVQSLRFSDGEDRSCDSAGDIDETGDNVAMLQESAQRRLQPPPQPASAPLMHFPPAWQRTNVDETLAEVDSNGGRPPATSRLRRLVKRLSRYSLREVLAYFNVFTTADGAGVHEIAAHTTQAAAFAHARRQRAGVSSAFSASLVSTSFAADASRTDHTPATGSPTDSTHPPPPAASVASAAALSVFTKQHKELPSVSAAGQIFVLLHYLGFVLLTVAVIVLAVFEFRHDLVAAVQDETACNRFPYKDLFRPDFSFSLICFFLNSAFATHYALRAVRYEKGGLLVVQVVITALQVCRAAYFLLFVADRYLRRFDDSNAPPDIPLHLVVQLAGSADGLSGSTRTPPFSVDEPPRLVPLLVFTWVSVITSVALFFLASLTIPWVGATFGWRRYAQGIVSVRLERVRQRLTTLQTCVQLDRVITLNAHLATVFLLDTWHEQRELVLVTGATLLLYALLVPTLRHTRHWWPLLCGGCVLLAVSGYFAALIGDSLQNDYRLRAMSSSPWYSACYTEQLPECLRRSSVEYPISIYRDDRGVGRNNASLNEASYKLSIQAFKASALNAKALPGSSLAAIVGSPVETTSPAAAIPQTSFLLGLDRVDNTSDTYIPTFGAFHDYFRICGCNETCFCEEEEEKQHLLVRSIDRCCGYYGQCRLKDAYRTYAVILLALLTVLSYVVRVVLLAVAWRRSIGEDDATIELFLREKQGRRDGPRCDRHLHSQLSEKQEQDAHKQLKRGDLLPRPRALPRTKMEAVASTPSEALVWNLNQYDAWRYESEGGGVQAGVAGGRAPRSLTFQSAGENPLSR